MKDAANNKRNTRKEKLKENKKHPYKKTRVVEKNLIKVAIILFVLSVFVLYFNTTLDSHPKESSNQLIEKAQDCANLSLINTSRCLRNYISTFYNYTIRPDTIKTLEDIKQNGGDCFDYSSLYSRFGKELGFRTFIQTIYNKEIYHKYAVILDDGGYCVMDQLIFTCFTFKKKNNETKTI